MYYVYTCFPEEHEVLLEYLAYAVLVSVCQNIHSVGQNAGNYILQQLRGCIAVLHNYSLKFSYIQKATPWYERQLPGIIAIFYFSFHLTA